MSFRTVKGTIMWYLTQRFLTRPQTARRSPHCHIARLAGTASSTLPTCPPLTSPPCSQLCKRKSACACVVGKMSSWRRQSQRDKCCHCSRGRGSLWSKRPGTLASCPGQTPRRFGQLNMSRHSCNLFCATWNARKEYYSKICWFHFLTT